MMRKAFNPPYPQETLQNYRSKAYKPILQCATTAFVRAKTKEELQTSRNATKPLFVKTAGKKPLQNNMKVIMDAITVI
jgi:hypothetical protein